LEPLRTIRQEPKFDEEIQALGISCQRLDEILEAVSFGLARAPEAFPCVPGTRVSILKTAVYPGAPSLRVFFTYNEDEVHLLMVEFCEDDVTPLLQYEE
jgi:hypothetical protein